MALKLRKLTGFQATFPVGAADIAEGAYVKLSSSKLIVTTGNEDGIGFMDEAVTANAPEGRVNIPGPIVFALAHDNAIAENERVVPAAAGRVDGIGTLTGGTTYSCGISLMASSAQDQKIAIIQTSQVLPKAAS